MIPSSPSSVPLKGDHIRKRAWISRGMWLLMVNLRMGEKRVCGEVLRHVLTQHESVAPLRISGSDVIGIEA
jgi:hypothetical protein